MPYSCVDFCLACKSHNEITFSGLIFQRRNWLLRMNDKMSAKLLIFEDVNPTPQDLIDNFVKNGFESKIYRNGMTADHSIQLRSSDAVIINVSHMNRYGFVECLRIRDIYDGPIIMLAFHKNEMDECFGLSIGADDYIVSDADHRVIVERVKSCVRRASRIGNANIYRGIYNFGKLVIDSHSRTVRLPNGTCPHLTSSEFDLLLLIARRAGNVVMREEISHEIFKRSASFNDRAIDALICKIRYKLNDSDPSNRKIIAIRNKGYIFSSVPWN